MNIPFSVFISTRHVESGDRFPTYVLRVGFFYNFYNFLKIPTIDKEFDISTEKGKINGYRYVIKIIKTSPIELTNKIINDVKKSMPHDKWLEINDRYSSDEPMNWRDVDELNNAGVNIGSHCHDHFLLHTNQPKKNVNKQLNVSKSLIEKRYGSCSYFSYPNGTIRDISHHSYNYIKNIYSLGFTTCAGEVSNATDKYFLPRIGAPEDLGNFKFNMSTSFIRNRIYKMQVNSLI